MVYSGDATHPDGDIEIVCTGLRPGEKLFEELLIDAESQPTSHPIFRAHEDHCLRQLWPQLQELDAAITAHDVETALELLASLCRSGEGLTRELPFGEAHNRLTMHC